MGGSMMRSTLVLTLFAAVAAAEEIPLSALGPRPARFTYEARVTAPPGARVLELWLPLPREDDQAIMELHLKGTAPATVGRLSPSGDRVAYLRVTDPQGTVTLAETAAVSRREVR